MAAAVKMRLTPSMDLAVDLSVDHAYLGSLSHPSSPSGSPPDQEVPRLQVQSSSVWGPEPLASRRKKKSQSRLSPLAGVPKVALASRGTPSITPSTLPPAPPPAPSEAVVIDITLENGRILPASASQVSPTASPSAPWPPSQARVAERVPPASAPATPAGSAGPAHWTRPRPPSPFNALLDFANIVVSFERVTEQDSQKFRDEMRASNKVVLADVRNPTQLASVAEQDFILNLTPKGGPAPGPRHGSGRGRGLKRSSSGRQVARNKQARQRGPKDSDEENIAHHNARLPDQAPCTCGKAADDGPMVECTGCQVWCHFSCYGFAQAKDVPKEWVCTACAKR